MHTLFNSPSAKYNIASFGLPQEFLREITQIEPRKTALAITSTWLQIALLVGAGRLLMPSPIFWVAYVPLIFLIAGRQAALLQLLHEAAHQLLSKSPRVNANLANWFCAYPIGLTFEGYAKGHVQHHQNTNTAKDPQADTEKYRVTDVRKPELYRLLLKDLLGLTALQIFFTYKKDADDTFEKNGDGRQGKWRSFAALCAVQLALMTLFFRWNVAHYLLLWLIPAMSPHMFLMRIRGIAEHGLHRQLGVEVREAHEGAYYTRSFLTPQNTYGFAPVVWLEKMLIGSFAVYYHHEHHLVPNAPFYNLSKLHRRIAAEAAARNPEVYARGYFTAALRNILGKP